MSYWVELKDDDGEFCQANRHREGGTVEIAGTTDTKLNVTYNYSEYFYEHLDDENGLRALDGDRAEAWIDELESAVEQLGTDQADDYWESTAGNAGHALNILLRWARMYPDARFEVR